MLYVNLPFTDCWLGWQTAADAGSAKGENSSTSTSGTTLQQTADGAAVKICQTTGTADSKGPALAWFFMGA